MPVAVHHLKPILHGHYTHKIVCRRPLSIDGVHRQTDLYRFPVVFIYQNRDFITCRLTHLCKPFGFVGPSIGVMFTLYRMIWDVDVRKVFLLILVQISFAIKIYVLGLKPLIYLRTPDGMAGISPAASMSPAPGANCEPKYASCALLGR